MKKSHSLSFCNFPNPEKTLISEKFHNDGRHFSRIFFIVQTSATGRVKRLKPQQGSLAGGTMLIIEGEGKLLFLDFKDS